MMEECVEARKGVFEIRLSAFAKVKAKLVAIHTYLRYAWHSHSVILATSPGF